ncbi:hypothetical protein [Brassicibacter mesophilus]|uniref:hypothetical protein n=1 Tax=Brassicibacter mesophilus TaxID=745119 RepID=UPI003D2235EA
MNTIEINENKNSSMVVYPKELLEQINYSFKLEEIPFVLINKDLILKNFELGGRIDISFNNLYENIEELKEKFLKQLDINFMKEALDIIKRDKKDELEKIKSLLGSLYFIFRGEGAYELYNKLFNEEVLEFIDKYITELYDYLPEKYQTKERRIKMIKAFNKDAEEKRHLFYGDKHKVRTILKENLNYLKYFSNIYIDKTLFEGILKTKEDKQKVVTILEELGVCDGIIKQVKYLKYK